MDFKDRFKGRTATIGKVGVIDTLASAANPVQKSQSNAEFTSYSKAMVPIQEDPSRITMNQRMPAQHNSVDSRSPIPPQVSQSYNRSPGASSTGYQNYPPRIPTGSNNPYVVNNPMPALNSIENGQYRSYENSPDVYARKEFGMQQQQQPYQPPNVQNVVVSQFNPNSFYNQHSQYKTGLPSQTPKKENGDQFNSYAQANATQQYKKTPEIPGQPTKQKRVAEEVLRGGYENYPPPQRTPNGRYEGYEQAMQNQGPMNQRPPQSMPGYNGYRDIHSNPLPQQYYHDANNFSYTPHSMQHQYQQQQGYEEASRQTGQGQPKYANQSKTTYKPYNIKDYKDMKMRTPVNLGGLGPNTNTDEWYKEREKRDKMTEFSQNVKMFNAQRVPATDIGFKPRKDNMKEKSRREIALEFAKNVPKPKQRKQSPTLDDNPSPPQRASKRPESETRAHYRSPMGNDDLDELEQRHNQYLAQLERMKHN